MRTQPTTIIAPNQLKLADVLHRTFARDSSNQSLHIKFHMQIFYFRNYFATYFSSCTIKTRRKKSEHTHTHRIVLFVFVVCVIISINEKCHEKKNLVIKLNTYTFLGCCSQRITNCDSQATI